MRQETKEALHLDQFLLQLNNSPKDVDFSTTMSLIDSLYTFTPSKFTNGSLTNEAGENSGSCKLFAFAALHQLDKAQTLYCFGQYYSDVLATPDKNDHQNIRNFMQKGWDGMHINNDVLVAK